MFTVPGTRGSRMKLLPVCRPTVLITDWMSAFTKFTVIFSSPFDGTTPGEAAAGAGAWAWAPNEKRVARANAAHALRNIVTKCGFSIDLTDHCMSKTGRRAGFL